MNLDAQAKILRVIENKQIQRVGSQNVKNIDVRFISATNKSLKTMMTSKTFRDDLYYRISTLPLVLPSLNERKDDLRLLSAYFAEQRGITINDGAMRKILNYNWPGNVRELKSVINRAALISESKKLNSEDITFNPDF